MIDFRYHLVSILAVFLSLGLGLVVGATALSDPLLAELKSRTSLLVESNQDLRDENEAMASRLRGDGQFARMLGPQLVAGRLKGERVVFVETPGSDDELREQLAQMVTHAGATYTGSISIQGKYLAQDQLAVLTELTDSVKPDGVTLPANESPYDRVAAVLASVLVTDESSRAGREEAAGGEVLAGFKDQGFLTTSGKPGARATLAVVIAPSTLPTDKSADTGIRALAALPVALDEAGRGAVLAGPVTAAQDGGLIAALRGSDAAGKVSTVDTADTASGQVVTVLALVAETNDTSGKYGIGSGVDGYLPTSVPGTGKRT